MPGRRGPRELTVFVLHFLVKTHLADAFKLGPLFPALLAEEQTFNIRVGPQVLARSALHAIGFAGCHAQYDSTLMRSELRGEKRHGR